MLLLSESCHYYFGVIFFKFSRIPSLQFKYIVMHILCIVYIIICSIIKVISEMRSFTDAQILELIFKTDMIKIFLRLLCVKPAIYIDIYRELCYYILPASWNHNRCREL